MKTYNKNERLKAIMAVTEKGIPLEQVAITFGCSKSSIYRWIDEYKTFGKIEPAKGGSYPKVLTQDDEAFIIGLVDKQKDITIAELIEKMDKKVGTGTMHRCLVRLGFAYKKNIQGRRAKQRRCHKTTARMESVTRRN